MQCDTLRRRAKNKNIEIEFVPEFKIIGIPVKIRVYPQISSAGLVKYKETGWDMVVLAIQLIGIPSQIRNRADTPIRGQDFLPRVLIVHIGQNEGDRLHVRERQAM